MLFEKIILENFKSYKDETIIDVSISDSQKNIILIGGKNGSGKTTIIEALNTVLYGADPRKIISYINDCAIQEGNAMCRLGLIFLDDSMNKIEIERTWTVRGVYGRNEDNIKPSMIEQKFVVKKNGGVWDIDENRWKEEIEVKIPKGVSEFFFFAGEAVREMASDITPNTLKSSMEKVIGLEKINTLIYDLGKVKEKVLTGNTSITNEQIENQKLKIMMKENEINQELAILQRLRDDKNDIEEEKSIKEGRYRSLFGDPEVQNDKIKEYDDNINKIRSDITLINSKITEFFNKQLPFSLMGPFYKKLNSDLILAKEYREYNGRKSSQETIKQKIIDGLFKPNDVIWNNPWNDDYKVILENKLGQILSENEKEKSLLYVTENDEQKLYQLWENIDFYGDSVIGLIKEKEKKNNELKYLENEKENLFINPDKIKEQQELQHEIGKINVKIGEIDAKIETSDGKFNTLNDEKTELYRELRVMQSGFQQFEKQRVVLEKIDLYLKVLKDYKDKFRNDRISKLTSNIESMFRKLYEKESLLDSIKIDPENFEIQLFDKDGLQIPKVQLSDGEKTLFAISTIWGLSKTSDVVLPIVTDAPISSLGKGPAENVLKNYFPNASSQVILLIKDRDLMPNSPEYNLIKPFIEKEYVLNFDNDSQLTTLHEGYFYNY